MKKRIVSIVFFVAIFIGLDRGIGCCINEGLNKYFGLNQQSDVLFIGHSHLMLAVNKSHFEQETGIKVSKYCREGVNAADRYEMVKQYLALPNSDSLKVVFYGVDQFIFTGKGLSKNSYKLFYPFIDNPSMDEYIRKSTNTYDYWLHKLICSTRYSDALLNSSLRGWNKDWSNYKIGTLNLGQLKEQIKNKQERPIEFEKELITDFEKTLELLKQKKVVTILVNTPIAKELNEYEPDQYRKINNYFQSKVDSTYVFYWNLNPEFSQSYDLFYDPIHLNRKGQQVINKVLVNKYLKLTQYDIGRHSPL